MSWYRQYRPQTVSALHISPVREAFQRILDSGEFSHAYLLTGPKGTGKTSGARILAKVLNCEDNHEAIAGHLGGKSAEKKKLKFSEPCNNCATCLAITGGSSFCVMEMDGASNRGIDDVRDLTSKVGLAPGDGLINVVIIDEVHMLTTEAFNALLKVLEEPPAHVVFILATTDAQKMPPTVISRCVNIQYRKATSEEVINALNGIAEQEKIEVDTEAFSQIVSFADGSFRDGVKVFEQIAKGKAKVTLDDVRQILGKSVGEISESLLQSLAKRDASGVAQLFSKITSDGIDMLTVQKEVLKALHGRMISAHSTQNPHLPTYVAMLKALNLPPSNSLPFPGIPFEIACLEWCLQKTLAASPKAAKKETVASSVATVAPPQIEELRKKKDQIDLTPADSMSTRDEVVDDETSGEAIEYAVIIARWHEVLKGIREKNPSVEALLRTTKPQGIENNVLSLEVFYKFHKEQLETARNYFLIKDVLRSIFSSKIKIIFVMGEKANVAANSPDSNLSGVVDLSFVKAAEDAFLT